MRRLSWISLIFFVVSCASTNRTKTLLSMGVLGAGGAAAGALSAPKNENAAGHALLWGAVSAAVTSVVALFVFDEQKVTIQLARD